jgi:tartrate dehydratase alpha subunit/fumarate hydratase class I-like protein
MIQPEILHLVFAAAGLALGWYLKHQSIKVPPDVLAAIEDLLARKQQTQGHTFLQDLLEAARAAEAPASPRSPSP